MSGDVDDVVDVVPSLLIASYHAIPIVCVGATEGMFAALQSVINPGDEVIVMEPAFDIYRFVRPRVGRQQDMPCIVW